MGVFACSTVRLVTSSVTIGDVELSGKPPPVYAPLPSTGTLKVVGESTVTAQVPLIEVLPRAPVMNTGSPVARPCATDVVITLGLAAVAARIVCVLVSGGGANPKRPV